MPKTFSGPIPGESLTSAPGSRPFENPPQHTNINDAAEFIWKKMSHPTQTAKVVAMLKEGATAEMVTKSVLAAGFQSGRYNGDVRAALHVPVLAMVAGVGQRYSDTNFNVLDADTDTQEFFRTLQSGKVNKDKIIQDEFQKIRAERNKESDAQKVAAVNAVSKAEADELTSLQGPSTEEQLRSAAGISQTENADLQAQQETTGGFINQANDISKLESAELDSIKSSVIERKKQELMKGGK